MNDVLRAFIGIPITNITRDEYAGPLFILGDGAKTIWILSNGWCVKRGDDFLLGSDDSEEHKNAYLSCFIGLSVIDIVIESTLMLIVKFSEEVVLYIYNTLVEDWSHHIIFFGDKENDRFNVSFDACMAINIEFND